MNVSAFEELAHRLGFSEDHYDILRQALTHKSYLGEVNDLASNERMEFLGDSILGMIVSEQLFSTFGEKQEGELAKAKAVAVSETILADASRELDLADAIFLSTGEESSGGRTRPSILADTFEAIVAAMYLSMGLEVTREFVLKSLGPILEDIESDEHHRNYKSLLQELSQSLFKKAPKYIVIEETGADHDKTFIIEAQLDGQSLGQGAGKSKKQAEQASAFEALKHPIFKKTEDSC
jgi:ribonuclease-3